MITTSISDAHSARSRTPALSFCHRCLRGVGGSRNLLIYVAFLVVGGLAAPPTRADLIYTWTETAGTPDVTGMLMVNPLVLKTGTIDVTDVSSFSFQTPNAMYTTISLDSTFRIDIAADGEITSESGILYTSASAGLLTMNLFEPPDPCTWSEMVNEDPPSPSGSGYWTSAVPEPSSLVAAGFACICGIAWHMARHRRAARTHQTGAKTRSK